jgi:hypothetical protein
MSDDPEKSPDLDKFPMPGGNIRIATEAIDVPHRILDLERMVADLQKERAELIAARDADRAWRQRAFQQRDEAQKRTSQSESTRMHMDEDLRRYIGKTNDLRHVLQQYADPKNWVCRRCGKANNVNCFMGLWRGSLGEPGEDGHGYSLAQEALEKEKSS